MKLKSVKSLKKKTTLNFVRDLLKLQFELVFGKYMWPVGDNYRCALFNSDKEENY